MLTGETFYIWRHSLADSSLDSAAEAFAWKWGFQGDMEKTIRESSGRFSLLKDGTLDRSDCSRLLLIQGTEDTVFPVDDTYLCLEHGPPKEVR